MTEFVEKPEPAQIDTDEVNAGAYVLERSVAERIPAGRAVSIEREVFPELVGHGLYARAPGGLLDGHRRPRALPARRAWDILERRVETDAGDRLDDDGMLIEEGAEVAGDADRPGADRLGREPRARRDRRAAGRASRRVPRSGATRAVTAR